MLKFLSITLLVSLAMAAFTQKAVIREKPHTMNSYPFSDPDPVAAPGRIYPYFRFYGYTNEGKMMEWNMVGSPFILI